MILIVVSIIYNTLQKDTSNSEKEAVEHIYRQLRNAEPPDYETAKGITFRYLYGGLDAVAEAIPFFQRVSAFIRDQYRLFVTSGKLRTPIFGREIPFQRIEAGGEQKIFNYLLQALETEVNYGKMREIITANFGQSLRNWHMKKSIKLTTLTVSSDT